MGSNGEKLCKEGWKWCKIVQGGAAVVQNGARRGQRWCKMGQGGVETVQNGARRAVMVQNGARRGGDGAEWSKEGW